MAYAAELCGSKYREKLTYSLNESSSEKISTTSFAAKQMAKMGWQEGTGLGKNRDGIVSHIKVKKREESMGLGVEKERTRQLGVEGMWWSSNVADTLMRLQQKKTSSKDEKSKKKKKSKKDKKKKEKKEVNPGKVYTDEELFQATGGARFGTKGGKRSLGKWQRSESSKEHKEWEESVREKVEWNGLGKAKVLLNGELERKSKGKKRRRDNDESSGIVEEKKEDDTALSSTSVLSDNDEKKQRKSEKKKSKKKSKSRDSNKI